MFDNRVKKECDENGIEYLLHNMKKRKNHSQTQQTQERQSKNKNLGEIRNPSVGKEVAIQKTLLKEKNPSIFDLHGSIVFPKHYLERERRSWDKDQRRNMYKKD